MKLPEADLNENIEKVFYIALMFNFGMISFNFGHRNSKTLEYVSFGRGILK